MRPNLVIVSLRQASGLLLLLLLVGEARESVRAAAPPPWRATLLAERNRWWRETERLHQEGKLAEATAAAEKMLAIERKLFGNDHADVAGTLESLSALLEQREDFAAALRTRREVLAVRVRLHGRGHWRTTVARLALAHCQRLAGMGPEQRRRLSEAEKWNSQAVQLYRQGKYVEALPLARKTKEVHKEVLGERHPNYAQSLNNLAVLHYSMGNHKQALLLYQQALKIKKEVLGERHPEYANSLHNLASLYKAMGDHKQALPLIQQALKLRKEVLGEGHPYYADSLDNLAVLYDAMGDNKQSLPLYKQALKIRKEVLGEKHPAYADSLHNLAALYRDMGDHKQALPFYQQVLKLRKEVLGEKHPDYATSLNNLAALYADMGEHRQALPLFQRALKLRKEVLAERHPEYANSLNNLASIYQAIGDHKQALPLYQEALKLYKEVVGERHPDYATSLHDLASLHRTMGDHKQALPLYQQALKIIKEVQGERHPDYANSLYNLAALYQALHDGKQARSFSDQALAITRDHLLLAASVQSERQQLSATQDVRPHLDLRLSLSDPVAEGAAASYRHALAWKGAVFARQQQRRLFARLLATDRRAEVRGLVEELQQASRLLAAAAVATTDSARATARREQLEKLTRQKEDLEARLSGLSSEFRATQKRIAITPQALHQRLPAGVVLVDFLFYTRHDHTQIDRAKRFQRQLIAFVVRKGRPVVRIDLSPAAAVEQSITAWRRTLGKKQRGKEDAGQTLRKLLWLPLQKHIADAKVVLLSPDGALAKLPFAALPGSKEGVYLLEEVALAVVPVPQLLPELLAPVPEGSRLKPSLLVVGDVDFDSAEKVAASADDRSAPRGGLNGWQRLAATADEASAVKDSFSRLFKGGAVTDLRKAEARKSAVRQALQKSRYAHLATHGFFAPAELKSAVSVREGDERLFGTGGVSGWHPLLLSGIVLSGANKEAKPGEEDGILTALEVSEMDLTGLELAVLSACETGLGQQASGEGLLGLQRAFAVAGTRSVVASLWKVPDRATQSLMAEFYRVAWDRKSVVSRVEALRRAQLAMLREGVKRGMLREGIKRGMLRREDAVDSKQRLLPYYWAAFVLSGDWR